MKPVEALPVSSGWQAALQLGFKADEARTWLAQRHHSGPLVVQRCFYPEDAHLCQAVIVHPPGGIAGGDDLEIGIRVDEQALVQLTTPGAGKWYRGFGRDARQSVRIRVGSGALCEWLPQENIIFDGALAHLSLEVELAANAVFCGWDFTCLGRPHSRQPFGSGLLRQLTAIQRDGKPLFREQARLDAADEWLAAAPLLGGHCAYGSMLIAGLEANKEIIAAAQTVVAAEAHAGVTRLGDVLVARWVGNRIEAGRQLFTRLWSLLRPWYAGRAAVLPRIWAT